MIGCAHGGASEDEVSSLRAQLRLERDRNQQLQSRVDRLEAQTAVFNAKKAPSKEHVGSTVPELSVVKLKPKATPAPRIDTSVDVFEPTEDAVEELGNKGSEAPLVFTDEDAKDLPSANEELIDAEFNVAMNDMKVGNLEGGVLKLQSFAASHARHTKADNALYFAGVGMMGLEDFDSAAKAFGQIVDNYPAGDATVDAMLKLAECRMKLNQTADAKALLARVVESYPGTPAANAAQARLTSMPRGGKEAP